MAVRPYTCAFFLKRFFNYLIVKFSISKVFVHTSINAYSVPKANYDARSSWDQLKETQREQQPQNVEQQKKTKDRAWER